MTTYVVFNQKSHLIHLLWVTTGSLCTQVISSILPFLSSLESLFPHDPSSALLMMSCSMSCLYLFVICSEFLLFSHPEQRSASHFCFSVSNVLDVGMKFSVFLISHSKLYTKEWAIVAISNQRINTQDNCWCLFCFAFLCYASSEALYYLVALIYSKARMRTLEFYAQEQHRILTTCSCVLG